jgi:hypothetical protein
LLLSCNGVVEQFEDRQPTQSAGRPPEVTAPVTQADAAVVVAADPSNTELRDAGSNIDGATLLAIHLTQDGPRREIW